MDISPETNHYQRTLASLRKDLSNPNLSTHERHKKAEMFRQKVAWQYADSASSIKEAVERNPGLSAEELKKAIKASDRVIEEHILDTFVKQVKAQIARTRAKKQRLFQKIAPEYGYKGGGNLSQDQLQVAGRVLFKEMTAQEPKGAVLILPENETAVTLLIEKSDDFKLAFPGLNYKDVEGTYIDRASDADNLEFPLILINCPMGNTQLRVSILSHEIGHAYNCIISKTLDQIGRRKLFPLRDPKRADEAAKHKALLHAKHELLADSQTGDLKSYDFSNFYNVLTGDKYKFKLGEKSEKIWNDYTSCLKKCLRPVEDFVALRPFSNKVPPFLDLAINTKNRILPYLLAQFPIEQWPDRLAPYIAARKSMIEAYEQFERLIRDYFENWSKRYSDNSSTDILNKLIRENTFYIASKIFAQRILSETQTYIFPEEEIAQRIREVSEQIKKNDQDIMALFRLDQT